MYTTHPPHTHAQAHAHFTYLTHGILIPLFNQVSSDGLISFGKPVVYSYPAKFPSNYAGIRNAYLVAPFWIFNDIRTAGSVSYVTINNKDALQLVSKYISTYYNTSFSAKWMLAVQWKGIHPYPHGGADWWWGSYYGDTFAAIINKVRIRHLCIVCNNNAMLFNRKTTTKPF